MPQYDGTGPTSAGPLTGRGLGPCGGGRARGRFFGGGMGWRQRGWKMIGFNKAEEKDILREEAANLEEELKEVKSRLIEIDQDK